MRRLVPAVLIAVAGVAGFLLGRATQEGGGRAGSKGFETVERAPPYRVNLPVEEVVEQQRRVARLEALEAENAVLRQRLEEKGIAAVEGELSPGARRPDGTIVGGARWGVGFVQVATSFVEEFFSSFIREAQLTFLRGNGKLPDYIDVGTDLWFSAYDWHVRWQQPLTVGRDPGGRLTLQLIATQLVLRSDAQGNFMSLPYDQRG